MNRRRLLEFAARSVAGVLAGGAVDTMTAAHAASYDVSRSAFIEVTEGARLTFTARGEGRSVLLVDGRALPVLQSPG